jgi:hypothetical protein
MSLEFLDRIVNAFGGDGGPWRDERPTRYTLALHTSSRRVAHGSSRVGKHAGYMRMATKHEGLWAGQHAFDAAVVSRTHTSARALRLAVIECRYPAVIASSPIMAVVRGTKQKRVEGEKNKIVSFAPLATCRSDSYS